jgi:ribosomal protein S7
LVAGRVRSTRLRKLSAGILTLKEALMASIRNDRARARNLLGTVYPVPDDVEFRRLRELAIEYIREAERLEAENRGREVESDEMVSAALDAIARDYFARALLRAVSHRKR